MDSKYSVVNSVVRKIEKVRYLCNGLTDYVEIRHYAASWPSEPHQSTKL